MDDDSELDSVDDIITNLLYSPSGAISTECPVMEVSDKHHLP